MTSEPPSSRPFSMYCSTRSRCCPEMRGPTTVSAASGARQRGWGPRPATRRRACRRRCGGRWPGRCGADLARVEPPHADQRGDRLGEVGVFAHDAGALAAELEEEPLHRLPAGLENAGPDRGRPGERDHVDVLRVTSASPTSGRSRSRRSRPGREADLLADVGELDDGQRVLGGGLHHDRVPGREGRSDLPAMFTSGKLYGEMQATTPTGWRRPSPPMRPPAARGVEGITDGGSGIDRSCIAPRRTARSGSRPGAPGAPSPPSTWRRSRP